MTAEELLTDIVRSEEASMAHWESCATCRTTPTCSSGREFLANSVSAMLNAKRFVDGPPYVEAWATTS